YKLSAIRRPGGEWTPRVKVSEQTAKVTTPGVLGVRRFARRDGSLAGDMIYDVTVPLPDAPTMVHPEDPLRATTYTDQCCAEELLVPVFRQGARVYAPPPITEARERALSQLALLDDSHKRFLNPHTFKVGLEEGLFARRTELIAGARRVEME
ncbi:MAG: nicotinate phosphoribosyltransferase, partial [Coriobacteriia bacterium]|nr:nicotinate phosphoribosyltransferase [Coriobacteriia bacterium]